MFRERALKPALVVMGLLFTAGWPNQALRWLAWGLHITSSGAWESLFHWTGGPLKPSVGLSGVRTSPLQGCGSSDPYPAQSQPLS